MKYQNARDLLKKDLLEQLQQQAGGRLLYVPSAEEKKSWGSVSGGRSKLQERNRLICRQAAAGETVRVLAERWFLSIDSIRKILAAGRNEVPERYLGIDVGGTRIKYGIIGTAGEILSSGSLPTPKTEQALVNTLCRLAADTAAELPLCGVGISCAGLIQNGSVRFAANLPLHDTPLQELVAGACGVPVMLENDANCAALGEYAKAPGERDLLYITLGTGIGAGIVVDGQLYRGSNGRAGEVGHMTLAYGDKPCPCGKRGCFEQYASTSALIAQVQQAVAAHPDSLLAQAAKTESAVGKLLFTELTAGCPVAETVRTQYLTRLAAGIDSLCEVLDPKRVVLAGGIMEQGEALLAQLQPFLYTKIPVTAAGNSSMAGVIGSTRLFLLAMQKQAGSR